MKSHTPLTDEAFTLLELIVVLSILSILSAAVIPVFGSAYESVQIERSVRDYAATLNFAHERAVVQSIEHRVYISNETGEFWVTRFDGIERGRKIFVDADSTNQRRNRFSDALTLARPSARRDNTTKNYYISFHPDGASDVSKVTVTRKGTRDGFEIRTTGVLGKVEIKEL